MKAETRLNSDTKWWYILNYRFIKVILLLSGGIQVIKKLALDGLNINDTIHPFSDLYIQFLGLGIHVSDVNATLRREQNGVCISSRVDADVSLFILIKKFSFIHFSRIPINELMTLLSPTAIQAKLVSKRCSPVHEPQKVRWWSFSISPWPCQPERGKEIGWKMYLTAL